jgi:hypothetical protein
VNTTDKGLPERLREMAASDMVPMEDAMRLMLEAADALSAASGKAVAWRFRVAAPNGNKGKWVFTDEPSVSGGCIEAEPLYLHPATVTDEDVERACIVMSRIGEDTEWPADYDGADQAAIRHFMRAALESFVRKQTAAEQAALERV